MLQSANVHGVVAGLSSTMGEDRRGCMTAGLRAVDGSLTVNVWATWCVSVGGRVGRLPLSVQLVLRSSFEGLRVSGMRGG